MCPGLSKDLPQIDDARKTAVISQELKRLNIDIAALQETRLPSNGSLKEEDYTLFWQGKAPEEHRVHGVGFAVRNSLLSSVEPPSKGTARILSLRLTTTLGPVNIMSAYAPTLCSTAEEKDDFYGQLETAIKEIPASEHLYLLGDFNARIGSDHFLWPQCIGHFGVAKLNENGQRLLELCSFHDLITNTFFTTKPHHRVQRQDRFRPLLMAPMHRPLWRRQTQRERAETPRAMLLPRPLHHKHVLHHKTPPQSVLAAPQISSLAPAGSRYHPQTPAEQCSVHPQLSQR